MPPKRPKSTAVKAEPNGKAEPKGKAPSREDTPSTALPGKPQWPWLTAIQYDPSVPELVLAAMYPGAPVPDHVREFVASVVSSTGMPDFVVEAAVWIVLWGERAATHNDLALHSMTRVLYSLSLGYCLAYVAARRTNASPMKTKVSHIGPCFSTEEQRGVRAAAKDMLVKLEEYRLQYGRLHIPPQTLLPQNPYWSMFMHVCRTFSTAMHVLQRDSAHLPRDAIEAINGTPVHMMVYRMSQPAEAASGFNTNCVPKCLHHKNLCVGEVLEVLQCAQFAPKEQRQSLVQASLEDVVGVVAKDRLKATVRDLGKLVNKTINFTRSFPGFPSRNPDVYEAVRAMCGFVVVGDHPEYPPTKPMLEVTPWHYVHRFGATDPAALWHNRRSKLTGADKRLPYIDALEPGPEGSEAKMAELAKLADRWWQVAPTMAAFARLCPPIIAIWATTVNDPVRDSCHAWKFQCELLNRTTHRVYRKWLPLVVLNYAAPRLLKEFCDSKGMKRVPHNPVYSYALHGEAIFGEDIDEAVL